VQYSLMVQIGTALLIGDATVLWYAIGHCDRWYIWALGSGLAAVACLVPPSAARLMKPVTYYCCQHRKTVPPTCFSGTRRFGFDVPFDDLRV